MLLYSGALMLSTLSGLLTTGVSRILITKPCWNIKKPHGGGIPSFLYFPSLLVFIFSVVDGSFATFILIRLDRDIQRGNNVALVVVPHCPRIWCIRHGLYFVPLLMTGFSNVSFYSRFQRFYTLVWVVALQRINWWKWWRLLSILEDPSRISTCAAFRTPLHAKLICPF